MYAVRVSADFDMRQNADFNLCGTVFECAIRLNLNGHINISNFHNDFYNPYMSIIQDNLRYS